MEIPGRLNNKFSGTFPDFGAIFMSNESTREECFNRKLFGLPISSADFVKGVKIGMILFLFEYEKRQLYGVFKATTDGELNIVPQAYISSGKKFPAQVRFTIIWRCHPLREHEFQRAIRDNYYNEDKFNFGLSENQVQRLLLLFESRKIRPLLSRSSIDSEIRKRYSESSSEKREMKKDRSNHTKTACKKLKRAIDSATHSNGEPLAYYGKLTMANDEPQLLSSGDSHIASKECDTMSSCSYYPENPCGQSSLAAVAGQSSTFGQELSPHHDLASQNQPAGIEKELKVMETSGNLDIDLEDYIPLLPSDDSDSTETRASEESGCFMTDQIGLSFSASGLFEDTCKPVFATSPSTKIGDVHIKENAYSLKSSEDRYEEKENSDYIYQCTSIRGLYSDGSDNRNVFSRLNFSSGVQDKEDECVRGLYSDSSDHRNVFSRMNFSYGVQDKEDECVRGLYPDGSDNRNVFSRLNFSSGVRDKEDVNIVKKLVHRTRKEKFSTRMDKSTQEIMEELEQMHDKWKKNARMTRYAARHNKGSKNQKPSVFSRLSRTSSEPDFLDYDISTRWQERHDELWSMGKTGCPVPVGKKSSVFSRFDRPSETDVQNSGNSTLLQEKYDKQWRMGETETPVSGKQNITYHIW